MYCPVVWSACSSVPPTDSTSGSAAGRFTPLVKGAEAEQRTMAAPLSPEEATTVTCRSSSARSAVFAAVTWAGVKHISPKPAVTETTVPSEAANRSASV